MRLIDADAAIDALNEQIEQCNKALGSFDIALKDEYAIKVEKASLEAYKEQLINIPTVQPERKDAIEKAVAVEAISDELMSRFDISATYAYEVAEKAMNRIEEMAKEMGKM